MISSMFVSRVLLVVLLLTTSSIMLLVAGQETIMQDFDAATACINSGDCKITIPTGTFQYEWKMFNPDTGMEYSGSMDAGPGSDVIVVFSAGEASISQTGVATPIATSTGVISSDAFRIQLDSSATRATPAFWVTLSYATGCIVPPGLLNTYFNPQLASGSGFLKENGEPKLQLSVELPAHIYDIELDFGDQCPNIPVKTGNGIDVGDCYIRYTIDADYTNECQFTEETGAAALTLSGSLVVRAKLNMVGTFDGDNSVVRTLEGPVFWKVSLQTEITVDTDLDVQNPCTCASSADCNGQTCDGCYCSCGNGLTGGSCMVDVEPPTCLPPATQTIRTPSLPVGLPAAFPGVTSTDNVSPVSSLTIVHSLGANPSFNALGSFTGTYTITDEAGNQSQCSYDIVVEDNGNPDLTCPADQTTATWTWPDVSASDLIDTEVAALLQSPLSPPTVDGTYDITYAGSDDSGNTGDCSFKVIWDTTPPVLTGCPTFSLPTMPGQNYAELPNWTTTATDALSGVAPAGITYSPAVAQGAQLTIQVSSTISTLSVSDNVGNEASCPFIVTVYDNEAPTVSCGSKTVSTQPGQNYGLWDLNALVSASDNVGVESSTSFDANQHYAVGTHQNTFQACDAAGKCAQCTVQLIVEDNETPVASCPENVNHATTAGLDTYSHSFSFSSTDNVAVTDEQSTHSSPFAFPIGTTSVTYTAKDAADNADACSFTVTVTDSEDPIILNCPADKTQPTDSGLPTAVVSWTAPTATDNDNVASLVSTVASGSTFSLATTTVTYTATDDSGNTATCSFVITVIDTEAPTIANCPSDMTADTDASKSSATITWTAPTESDNVGVVSWTSTLSSGASFPLGLTTVTYTATDAAGLSASCQFTVTVSDNEDPIISCPADMTVNTDATKNFALVAFPSATASDNDAIASITADHNSGDAFPESTIPGATTVTFTAIDMSNNSAQCSFTITVLDNEAPVVSCPPDFEVNTDNGLATATVTYPTSATSTDNLAIVSLGASPSSGTTFNMGSNTIVWSTDDARSNGPTTCQVTLTVTDKELPSITCPSSFAAETDAGESYYTATWSDPTNVDDNHQVATVVSDIAKGTQLTLGDHDITYTVTDASGNASQCTFTITVGDLEPPQITCPSSFSTDMDLGQSYFTGAWSPATAIDNMPVANGPITITVDVALGTQLAAGVHKITYTAEDANSNKKSCHFFVTVEDRQKPQVTCPANHADTTMAGENFNTHSYTITSSDNVAVTSTTESRASGSTFPIGTTTVTIQVQDAAGNSASCSFEVIITDAEKPVIACPADFKQNTDLGLATAAVNWLSGGAATATDNHQVASISYSHASGAVYPLGVTTITATAIDFASPPNSITCTFKVTVEDKENPQISCPADITLSMTHDKNYGEYPGATFAHTSSDNVAVTTVTFSHPGATQFPAGNTVVTGTAFDAAGNEGTCTFTITIQDTQAPTITCTSQSITLPAAPIGSPAAVTAITRNVAAADNSVSGPIDLSSQIDMSKTFGVGSVTENYCYSDAALNGPACCDVTVTVIDADSPVLECPADITLYTSDSNAVQHSFAPASLGDNNGPPTLTQSHQSGASFPLGITTVTFTASDGVNAASSCSFKITIEDTGKPVLTCPSDKTHTITTNTGSATIPHGTVLVTDNSGATLTATTTSGTSFDIGTHTVVYSATDAAGNSDTCSFTVVVIDGYAPTTSNCPASTITLYLSDGNTNPFNGASLVWSDNWTATGDLTLAASPSATAALSIGDNEIQYTATDEANNTGACVFNVKLIDDVAPEVVCPAVEELTLPADNNEATWVWNYSTLLGAGNTFHSVPLNDAISGSKTLTKGSHTFNIKFKDAYNNAAECNVVVNVSDVTDPVIACSALSTSTRILTTGATSKTVTYAAAEITDNSGSVASSNYSKASGTQFDIGATTVTVTATDASGNSGECTFTITVLPPYAAGAMQAALTGVTIERVTLGGNDHKIHLSIDLSTNWPHYGAHSAITHTLPAGISHPEEQQSDLSCVATSASSVDGWSGEELPSCRQRFLSSVDVPSCTFPERIIAYKFRTSCLASDCQYGFQEWNVDIALSAQNYCDEDLGNASLSATLRAIQPADYATYEAQKLAGGAVTQPTEVALALPGQTITGLVDCTSPAFELSNVALLAASQTYYYDVAKTTAAFTNQLVIARAAVPGTTKGGEFSDWTSFAFLTSQIDLDTTLYTKLIATVEVSYNLGTGTGGGNRRRILSIMVDREQLRHMSTQGSDDVSKLAMPVPSAVAVGSQLKQARALLQAGETGTGEQTAQTAFIASNAKFELPEGICVSGGVHFIGFSIAQPDNVQEPMITNVIHDHFTTIINAKHSALVSRVEVMDREFKLSFTKAVGKTLFYSLIYSDSVRTAVDALYLEDGLFKTDTQMSAWGIAFDNKSTGSVDKTSIVKSAGACGTTPVNSLASPSAGGTSSTPAAKCDAAANNNNAQIPMWAFATVAASGVLCFWFAIFALCKRKNEEKPEQMMMATAVPAQHDVAFDVDAVSKPMAAQSSNVTMLQDPRTGRIHHIQAGDASKQQSQSPVMKAKQWIKKVAMSPRSQHRQRTQQWSMDQKFVEPLTPRTPEANPSVARIVSTVYDPNYRQSSSSSQQPKRGRYDFDDCDVPGGVKQC